VEQRRILKYSKGARNTPDKDEMNTTENHRRRKK